MPNMASSAAPKRAPSPVQLPSGPGVRPASATNDTLLRILPAVLLLYAALIPFEVRVTLAEQTFYPPRIMCFLLLPWLVMRLPKADLKLTLLDYLMFAAAFWMAFAFMIFYGPVEGAIRGGVLAFDVAVPYIVGRLSITDTNDFRRFLVLIAPGIFLAGASMLAEVLVGQSLVRPAVATVFGDLPIYQDGQAVGDTTAYSYEKRLGMLRASGPFSHPILAGLFLASFFPLYFYSSLRKWPIFAGLGASLFAVFSASTAPIISLAMGGLLLAIDWFQRLAKFISWKVIIPLFGILLIVVHFGSQNGIFKVIIRYTLNPSTGYYRQLIWEYGVQSVLNHPLFGIGFTGYQRLSWMQETVDNHWLLLAIRFGVFPAFAILIVVIVAVARLSLFSMRGSEVERRIRVAMAISLFSFTMLGFSVAFFGGIQAWFYMFLAACVSIVSGHSNSQQQRAQQLVQNWRGPPTFKKLASRLND